MQQIVYGVALLFGALACMASGLVGRFDDIDLSGDLRSQYSQLKSSATPLLETNVAFVIFLSLLTLSNIFRKKATSVWFELIWTFVFGTMEVIDIVILANTNISAACHPSSASSLTKRDDAAADTTIGQVASSSADSRIAHASTEICQNWAVMLVLFAFIAVTLYAQWFWLALLGLRHRASNPDFFWCDATPAPLTWHLSPPTPSTEDVVSVSSSSASSLFNEKKASVLVPAPVPVQVRVQLSTRAEVDPRVC